MKLFFCNAPYSLSEADLRREFEEIGSVYWLSLITDRSGKSRGFGFLDMPARDGNIAIAELDGKWIRGRKLLVKESAPTNGDAAETMDQGANVRQIVVND
jgi:RNA recognition motif-containing protein